MNSKIYDKLDEIKVLLDSSGEGGGGGLTDAELRAAALHVIIDNPTDLTTVTAHLLAIKNSVAAIDVNTDTVEQKLLDVVTAINANGTVNHADLLTLLTELQAINANTDTQEAVLNSILSKIIAAPATLSEQQTQTTALSTINTGIGTDGAASPVIAGTGVRGWLRAIYETLAARIATLGQKTAAGSASVVLASDHSIINTRISSSATAAALGLFPKVSSYGTLRVTTDASAEFSDSFDFDDLVDNWVLKTAGTGTSTVTNGVLNCSSGTTSGSYGGRYSIPVFKPRGINFEQLGFSINIANSTMANTTRWWGFGTFPTTPTIAAPVQNGMGLILTETGSLFLKCYANSVEVGSADLTPYKLADGSYGRVGLEWRGDICAVYVGTTEYPVGSLSFKNPAIQTLPISMIAIAGATPPVIAATLQMQFVGLGDSGCNNKGISDGLFPSRVATVKKPGVIATAADLPLVVALHPLSPAPRVITPTYSVTFKATSRPYSLSKTFTANTRVQFATIWHENTSTKTVKLRRIELSVKTCSGTATIAADVIRITSAPATGNPVVTPSVNLSNTVAAEANCLALPTTAGAEGITFATLEFVLGNTGAAPTTNPPPAPQNITLFADTATEGQPLTMLAGVAEGFALVLDCNAAVTVTATVRFVFTEE